MASLEEKIAYLKGFTEALDIDQKTNEGKLLLKIVDALSDVSSAISDIAELQDETADRLEDIEDEIDYIEDDLYDDECDEDDEHYCDCCDDEDEDCIGEIECPDCGETISLTNDMFDEDSIACPNCGKTFNLEINCDCEDCDHDQD